MPTHVTKIALRSTWIGGCGAGDAEPCLQLAAEKNECDAGADVVDEERGSATPRSIARFSSPYEPTDGRLSDGAYGTGRMSPRNVIVRSGCTRTSKCSVSKPGFRISMR